MLEEILQEIEEMEYPAKGIGCGLEDEYITDCYDAAAYGFADARERIAEIIRNHMDGEGWIPCSERMPEVSSETVDAHCPEFNVTIKGATRATTLKCDSGGTWFDDNGNIYPVIAWRPLPDIYRSGQRVVGEDYKQQIMGRFLRQD